MMTTSKDEDDEDDEDNRRAEQLVAQAAIDYVDYFFPSSETGAGTDKRRRRIDSRGTATATRASYR